jgi:hypothetical protein
VGVVIENALNWLPPMIHVNVRNGTARGANGAATSTAMVVAESSVGTDGGDGIRCGGRHLFDAAADVILCLKSPSARWSWPPHIMKFGPVRIERITKSTLQLTNCCRENLQHDKFPFTFEGQP